MDQCVEPGNCSAVDLWNDDIWYEILKTCELREILSLEQTCRHIASLVSTRAVWIAVLRRLPRSYQPNIPPYATLASYSATDLRELIKTAFIGHVNWTSVGGPKPTRNTLIKINNNRDPPLAPHALLLPGGKYLLAQVSGSLLCYAISPAPSAPEEVWKFDGTIPGYTTSFIVCNLNYEVIGDGNEVMLVLELLEDNMSNFFLVVVQLDLKIGKATFLCTKQNEMGSPMHTSVWLKPPMTISDNVVVAKANIQNTVFVWEWDTGAALILDFSNIIPGEIQTTFEACGDHVVFISQSSQTVFLNAFPLAEARKSHQWKHGLSNADWDTHTVREEECIRIALPIPLSSVRRIVADVTARPPSYHRHTSKRRADITVKLSRIVTDQWQNKFAVYEYHFGPGGGAGARGTCPDHPGYTFTHCSTLRTDIPTDAYIGGPLTQSGRLIMCGSLNLYAVQLKESSQDSEGLAEDDDDDFGPDRERGPQRDNVNVMKHGPRLGTEFLLDMEYYSGAAVVLQLRREAEPNGAQRNSLAIIGYD